MSKQQRRRGMVAAVLGAGPTSDIRHPTWVLAGLAIMVFTAAAGASPIRFDNPVGEGHFVWFGGGSADPIGLDITLDAASQTGATGYPGVFKQMNLTDPDHSRVYGLDDYGDVQLGGEGDWFLVGVDLGDPIPSGFAWGVMGYTNYPGCESPLPYDVPTYLGGRFDLGAGWQYGWIGVVWSSADLTLDAFAWGYETEVGVPIPAGIPEPGSLALLAFGALAVCRRRQA